MSPTLSEKFIAYLALISGLAISAVAVYYSVVGLTAIFAAAAIPIIIMGVALEVSKLVATIWLKQNWSIAPKLIKIYLLVAIVVLMLITSMGIFGFLSKAHSDQSLVSGDVLARIAVYDEKIKTEKENIDVARKSLKQLDEAVDQVMGRSTDERGADKAAQIRRSQQRERTALQRDITNAQSNITKLNEERAPIAAEVRKVEAEVGPLKYIAAFVYGNTDQALLEKAVTWVIITLIIVFDPLAVILLLASQYSFAEFQRRSEDKFAEWTDADFEELSRDAWVADVGEKPSTEEKADIEKESWPFPTYDEITPKSKSTEGDSPEKESDIVSTATVTTVTREEMDALLKAFAEPAPHHPDTHPYLTHGFKYPEGWQSSPPMVYNPPDTEQTATILVVDGGTFNLPELKPEKTLSDYIQNEEQRESNTWSSVVGQEITENEYYKKALENNERQNNSNNPT